MRHWALLVICPLIVGVYVATGTAQPLGAHWNVAIGGETSDHAIQAQDYSPRTLTVHAGDSITWTKATLRPHTVHFLVPEGMKGTVIVQ